MQSKTNMSIAANITSFNEKIADTAARLIAVSKTKPISALQEAYDAGQRAFGENKVQEIQEKAPLLPKDIEWHMIGHLQRNKVKYIAPFVHLIHAVDSFKLLKEINKQALKVGRTINCLLQLHIAQEDTKFGFSFEEAEVLLQSDELAELENIKIVGVMGMATNTDNETVVRNEFRSLKTFFEAQKNNAKPNVALQEISMGMSGDYNIAIEEGSTMIRVGSAIFGNRNYQ